ncbi:MAG: deoxynucleotide monophosphate kinase [Gammaproteobacteria bacterium]|nr:deoxynucleotide monophosphate kinase [Gammaproteobacteria bacterium]MBU0884278.1 deoxynucleotide monophosphate kinase [Gammaproteobacteria bacterium]MBU1859816.1 deoxynucleotide monophosphate kinase [Gammaproteobacteria bacterium]
MKKIIGLAAKARSGKDTAASMLLAHQEVAAYALADPLKEGCKALFGLSDTEAWDDTAKEKQLVAWGRSPRQLFQQVGTEWMRAHDPLHWLKRANREISAPPKTSTMTFEAEAFSALEAPFVHAAVSIFGLSNDQLSTEIKRSEIDDFWGVSPASMIELIKSLALRDYPDFYSQRSEHILNNTNNRPSGFSPLKFAIEGKQIIIIKDIRFENEAEYIRGLGGEIWHIVRANADRVNEHSSEAGIQVAPSDIYIDNNGTLDQYKIEIESAWSSLLNRISENTNS